MHRSSDTEVGAGANSATGVCVAMGFAARPDPMMVTPAVPAYRCRYDCRLAAHFQQQVPTGYEGERGHSLFHLFGTLSIACQSVSSERQLPRRYLVFLLFTICNPDYIFCVNNDFENAWFSRE
ncbi:MULTISPECIES: hypothetical protein [Burkholderia cepacia complex]|uniref:hypothetical protein n=1 Tax=Burkholderia cepacia complex TaxID=87882 RepID=UPI0013DE445E|nr:MULTISPECIES: hypothetical protein [Burkholderia cepacia complex]